VLRRHVGGRNNDGVSVRLRPASRRQEKTEVDADAARGGQRPRTSPDVQSERGVRPTAQARAGVSAREEAVSHPDAETGHQVYRLHVAARRRHVADAAVLPVHDVAGSDVIDDGESRGVAPVQRTYAVRG